jgi:hypothetical protein
MVCEELLGTIFETLNKRIKIASIILGILWPITLLILCIVTTYVVFNNLNDLTK